MDSLTSTLTALLVLIGVAYTAISGRRNTGEQITAQRDHDAGERIIKADQVKLEAQRVDLLTQAEARAWMEETREYHREIISNLQAEAVDRTARLAAVEQAVVDCHTRELVNARTIAEQATLIAEQAARIAELEAAVAILKGHHA